MQRLSRIDNIVAVKECRIDQVAETAYLCGDNLHQYPAKTRWSCR
jgi:4-hydroxy-tetrahydrodipicolinate synthase